jgi:hypothetical protein
MSDSLIQQIDCLQQVRVSGGAKNRCRKKNPGLRVELKGSQIGSWLALDVLFLGS